MPGKPKGRWGGDLVAAVLGLGVVGAAVTEPTAALAQQTEAELAAIFRCVNMDQVACDEGRDLIFSYCTNCHTYGPIVLQQFDENGWGALIERHRDYVEYVSEEQFAKIQTYLANNFTPDLEPPEVPDYILKAWTDY